MNLLESSDYDKQIQSNGFSKQFNQWLANFFLIIVYMFVVLSDEELDSLLDRSDMVNSTPKANPSQSAKHFEVLT